MLITAHSWQGLPSSSPNTTTLAQLAITPLLLLGSVTRTLGCFDQRVMLAWILTTPVALMAGQLSFPVFLSKLMAAEGVRRGALIAGGGELAHRLQHCIEQSPHLDIRVAGCFDDRAPIRLHEMTPNNIIGNLGQVAAYAKQHHVDLIYINLPMTSQPRIIKLLNDLHDTTASDYRVPPDIFLFDLIQARVDMIGDMIRHKVRPGITGWAQVNGQRGRPDTLDKMKARIDHGLAYLRNWLLRLNLQIIQKTLFVVWKKQNAY